MKKYELTNETTKVFGHTLYRIKALVDFGNVKSGDMGGFIENENNLAHDGDAWVYGNASICDNARVLDNARVSDNACIYGNARVSNNARVSDNACIHGNARVLGNARVSDNAEVYGGAWVYGNACIYGDAWVYGDAEVYGDATIRNGDDILVSTPLGSMHRTTTFFRCNGNVIKVKCGCFCGTIKEFKKKVKKTHGDTKYAKEYNALIELAKIHFEI